MNFARPFSRLTSPFQKLWRGQQSLPTAYWLFLFLGTILTPVAALIVAKPFSLIHEPQLTFPFTFAVMVVYPIFASVGVWRSADSYLVSSSTPYAARPFCAIAAKIGAGVIVWNQVVNPMTGEVIRFLAAN